MKPIETDEIEFAAKILLEDKNKFYDNIIEQTGERIDVIKELSSKDIVASPGSGKTTTLLAKLLILANRMPFDDGRGICVLTHTNVAIDLIKEKLGAKSSKLFSYPNFFGTIQSFVDKYLACGAAIKYYEKRPDRIDNDIAHSLLIKNFRKEKRGTCSNLNGQLFHQVFASETTLTKPMIEDLLNVSKSVAISHFEELKKLKIIPQNKSPYSLDYNNSKWNNIKETTLDNKLKSLIYCIRKEALENIDKKIEIKILNLSLCYVKEKVLSGKKNLSSFEKPSGQSLKSLKETIFKEGILSFQDAFDISEFYLYNYPKLGTAIAERFRFIFIDEMQDTADYQINILDKLFKNDSPKLVLQCFGDPNQAIYDSFSDEVGWKPDLDNALFIRQSKRFGNNIASIINSLQVGIDERFPVEGNNSDSVIPCYVIVYNNNNDAPKVLDEFGKLIIQHKFNSEKSRFVALGRVGTFRDDDKITIPNYYPDYERIKAGNKEYYDYLILYLKKASYNNANEFKFYSTKIINAILQFLDKQNIKRKYSKLNNDGIVEIHVRRYSKTTLFGFLKKEKESHYHKLKFNIAVWSKELAFSKKSYPNELKQEIENYLKSDLITLWESPISDESFFQIPSDVNLEESSSEKQIVNRYDYVFLNDLGKKDSLTIDINTIHGEKGKTHTGTLYLETYYREYESITLKDQVLGKSYSGDGGPEKEKAMKLAYVGMSRPTNLLCFALEKGRVEEIDKFTKAGWIINNNLV